MEFVNPYRHINELNPVEKLKLDREPLDVAEAIVRTYAKAGPSAIAKVPGEVERLKWAGIYPQLQGGDAFMMRVKVPGGFLTAAQAREIGLVAETFGAGPESNAMFGNRYADITTRQTIQIHWIRIGDVPRIWERFEAVGLTTIQACGDSARNVLSCPVSGVDARAAFDALPVARAISDFFTGNREYANLPRKFKISVTGCVEDCSQAEINDIGMWPARASDGTLGFNLLVGGGLSDGERMASDIDVFVRIEDAVEITRAIAQVFGELGNRENRGLSRMRYLVQELGPEGFRAALAERTRLVLATAGENLTRRYRGDHVGVHQQRQAGLVYVGCSVPVGRLSGIDLVEAARLSEFYGDATVRLATDQNFILTGVPVDRVDALLAEELVQKYSPFPGPFSRGVVACTGNEFCRYAVVETKERAVTWARFLDRQLAHEHGGGSAHEHGGGSAQGNGGGSAQGNGGGSADGPVETANGKAAPAGNVRFSPRREDAGLIRMHFSGCSASCAQPQIGDIGFRGATAHVGDQIVEAVDIGMGGSLGTDAAFIDWIESARPVDEVPEALLRVVRRYQRERQGDEPFHTWARRVPNDDLFRTLSGEVTADHGDGVEGSGTAASASTRPKSTAAVTVEDVLDRIVTRKAIPVVDGAATVLDPAQPPVDDTVADRAPAGKNA